MKKSVKKDEKVRVTWFVQEKSSCIKNATKLRPNALNDFFFPFFFTFYYLDSCQAWPNANKWCQMKLTFADEKTICKKISPRPVF